ncbi:helix-turn-helix domain-containing protein [Paenibacillus thalictri]|uniref:AraC family transcriptional regulator n=1 Tax=Paenibacillus thalictri TaxID=2527873 RepID=A0A4Q9DLH6_9BACL|nr:helix-turn-helix domain-containing protein [Paenibacillus thalictri]TBL75987.1 AraC family transcriptional regulator [Paenibacillus thalictri]
MNVSRNILLTGYFSRMFWYSVIIVIFPVIVLGCFSYYKSSGIALQKVNEGSAQNTLQTELRMEQYLKAVDAASMQLVTSPLVNNSLDSELTYKDFQLIRDLREYMQRIQSYELGIQDIQLINTGKRWLLDNSGMYRFEDYESNLDLTKYVRKEKNSFWLASFPADSGLSTRGSRPALQLIRQLPLNAQIPTMFVVVKIGPGEINKYVQNADELGGKYVLDEYGTVLIDPSGEWTGKNFPNAGMLPADMSGDRPSEPVLTDFLGQRVSANFVKSTYNGWTYMTLVPVVKVTGESRAIFWITLFICLGIMALAFAGVYMYSKRLYRPVRKLYETVKGAALSAQDLKKQDEFQYIGERIQNLKMTQHELEDQLQGQMGQLKDYFVLKLVQGEVKAADVAENIRRFAFPHQWKTKAVLVAQLDSLEHTRFREADTDLILFAVSNIVSELVPAANRLSPILIHPSQVTLLGSETEDREEFKNQLYQLAEKIQTAVRSTLGLPISLGVSRAYSEWGDMPAAYQEGLEALKYRMKTGAETIIFIEDRQPAQRVKPYYPEVVAGGLLDAIKLLDMDRAYTLLGQFIQEVFSKESSRQEYQMSLARLLMELIDLAQQMGAALDQAAGRSRSLFERLLDMNSAAEIERWFREDIIGAIAAAVEQSRASQDTSISEQVLRMIHEQDDHELTLEACAARLHFHPSHVKRVFRRDVGVSFSEYVAGHRLLTAKKWLVQSEMKVNEIAERLQYNNAQNFIRYFRKMEGMTPGQYRELHKEWS